MTIMLNVKELFADTDRVDTAIMRIKEFEAIAVQMNPMGYHVCVSGGKDSAVVMELCLESGVKCHFVHNLTSVDAPETILYIREIKAKMDAIGKSFTIEVPRYMDGRRKTMWNGIEIHGLPSRYKRWCCEKLKEPSGRGEYIVTGVRWAESARRKKRGLHERLTKRRKNKIVTNNDNDWKRRLNEMCYKRRTFCLNPIIDWSDEDVWEFIRLRNLPINPLYSCGYSRVGCIGCSLSPHQQRLDFIRYPKYKAAYMRANRKNWDYRREHGIELPRHYSSPDEQFREWCCEKRKRKRPTPDFESGILLYDDVGNTDSEDPD